MRQPLIAGNWKMNGTLAKVQSLLAGIKAGIAEISKAEVAVCPPALFIPEVHTALQGTAITWGGQDLSIHDSGAYTGEISGPMLREFGCIYVIIGHSERRMYQGESNELVAQKFAAAVKSGLTPIFCVGESLEQREGGVTEQIVGQQVDAVIEHGGTALLGQGVIAYEPIWAIGTGRTATPEQAQEVHAFIRKRIAAQDQNVANSLRILYGGSMKPDNAGELLAKPDIDGGLIGGASLKVADFLAIYAAANQ
jgi:triosephosphate isomerase